MPSRQFSPPPLSHAPSQRPHAPPILTTTTTISAAFSLLLLLTLCLRKLSRKPSPPSPSPPTSAATRFSLSSLRRATEQFSPSRRLGQGGFGSVYLGHLPAPIAVKVMDSGSLQGEREFHNELFFASKIDSPFVIKVLGFASDRKRRRMMIVYELMSNGSLQDCLFHKKSTELRDWGKRFSVGVGIGKGIEYLHHYCDPPIIHGDIKPSNVLLDEGFNPRISDFGLARLKEEVKIEIVDEGGNGKISDFGVARLKEEVRVGIDVKNEDSPESVLRFETSPETSKVGIEVGGRKGYIVDGVVEQSPESVLRVEMSPETLNGVELSPEGCVVSPRAISDMVSPEGVDKMSVSEANFDGFSVESGRAIGIGNGGGKKGKKKKSVSGKDWWWKQDNGGGGQSGPVKDYVMEWLGNEIKKERPKSNFAGTSSNTGAG